MQYNYSAHIVEQFEKVLANMGNRVGHNGIGMRFSRGVASTIKPLVEAIKLSPKFALPDNGDVLRNWGKVLEMDTGEFLRLPYPEVVLEYSFSDVSHLGPDRLLISKRLVICIEYDPYKDSPLGQTVRSMVGSNTDLSGARSWFSPCSSIPASGCPTLLPPRSRAPGKVAVPASCSSKTGAESNRRSAIPYSRSAESLPAR
jgi:hypothetical protein